MSLSFSFCQLDDGVGDGGGGGRHLLHHHQSGAVDGQHVTRNLRPTAARWDDTQAQNQIQILSQCNTTWRLVPHWCSVWHQAQLFQEKRGMNSLKGSLKRRHYLWSPSPGNVGTTVETKLQHKQSRWGSRETDWATTRENGRSAVVSKSFPPDDVSSQHSFYKINKQQNLPGYDTAGCLTLTVRHWDQFLDQTGIPGCVFCFLTVAVLLTLCWPVLK